MRDGAPSCRVISPATSLCRPLRFDRKRAQISYLLIFVYFLARYNLPDTLNLRKAKLREQQKNQDKDGYCQKTEILEF
jgi:hypothetical protein